MNLDLTSCPCGSALPYAGCCEPLHEGAPAPTALALIRSRFSAFALGLDAYLLSTWDPATRPADLELDGARTWRRLQIVDVVDGGLEDERGVVEFRASWRDDGTGAFGVQEERSRFRRVDGRWVYTDERP